MRKQEGKSSFGALKRGMRLLVDDIDDKDPTDIAYVFSGYAPLSTRLVEAAVKGPGWALLPEDVLKNLPGPSFDIEQDSQEEAGSSRRTTTTSPGRQSHLAHSSPFPKHTHRHTLINTNMHYLSFFTA